MTVMKRRMNIWINALAIALTLAGPSREEATRPPDGGDIPAPKLAQNAGGDACLTNCSAIFDKCLATCDGHATCVKCCNKDLSVCQKQCGVKP